MSAEYAQRLSSAQYTWINHGSATLIAYTLNDGLLQPRRLHVVQIEEVQQGRRVPEPDLQFRMPLLEEGIV